MKYYLLNNKQTVFFYAFFRQIDLSLDRSRWTSFNDLQYYYSDKISPEHVIKYSDNIPFEEKSITRINKFKFFFKKGLREEEFEYFKNLLLLFDKFLKSNEINYIIQMEKLRIDIAVFYNNVLGSKMSRKDLKRTMKIEHYYQNPLIQTIELKEFVPNDFEDKLIV
ncbi:hypothetical protein A0O34_08030 [Chryseobacterium glaciei]|uniref:Uncharacterized protein n=1 Tax=Chryseobacterium glaciei TaxID=1685010 RepID=A0A172XUA9_9FLAO|nr:hypothetical protein [Chryseobacterium glaciei]ANF50470.1 hypothetical protein A0O34_08030 [Chryseobacterium glaciei]